MGLNKLFRAGPIALTNTLTTNLLNPATATGGTNGGASSQYIVMKHIRLVNKTASAATVSFYIGATGANAPGTEFLGVGLSIAANLPYDWYGIVRLDAADFLVGGASAATTFSMIVEGEVGVAG